MCLGCSLAEPKQTDEGICNVPSFPERVPQENPLPSILAAIEEFSEAFPSPEVFRNISSNQALVENVAKALLCGLRTQNESECRDNLFDSASIPRVTLAAYLKQLFRGFRCSDSVFVCALVIMDRVLNLPPTSVSGSGLRFVLTAKNVHRLFFTCAVLANKYNEDKVWCNSEFARIGGVNAQDLNKYERTVLQLLGFKVGVSSEVFEFYHSALLTLSDPSFPVPDDPALTAPPPPKAHEVSRISLNPCWSGAVCGLARVIQTLVNAEQHIRSKNHFCLDASGFGEEYFPHRDGRFVRY